MPEVCPFIGMPGLQCSSLGSNENTLPIILLFSFNFCCRWARASQATFLCGRNDGDAGK